MSNPTLTPKPSQGRERRAHPRAKAEMPVVIGAQDRRVPARVRDISESGVSFLSPKPIPEMTVVKAEFELPAPAGKTVKISAGGAVVRCQKTISDDYEIAVFFMAVTEMEREAIRAFVNKQLAAC